MLPDLGSKDTNYSPVQSFTYTNAPPCHHKYQTLSGPINNTTVSSQWHDCDAAREKSTSLRTRQPNLIALQISISDLLWKLTLI